MKAYPSSIRSSLLMVALCLLEAKALAAGQVRNASQADGGYRIAGTVVSIVDGHPLGRARVSLNNEKDSQKLQSVVTSEDGKFQFAGLPAGKYSLLGAKRGFISAAYDEHDQLSTAIVTGAGVDTETLVLRLAPEAVITGRILDEVGEPVRHAMVALYLDDHSGGTDQIHQVHSAQTDDQGMYEITPVTAGTYFVSASGKPWYAVYPSSETERQGTASVDRSLDVAYPVTYYPDVTEADGAMPIPVRGGDRVQVDIHLVPVQALRLLFHMPDGGPHGIAHPQLQQSAFDGSTSVESGGEHVVAPGVLEVTGIPPGKYSVRAGGAGPALQMNGIDLTKDGQEVDTSSAEILGSVKVSVHLPGESGLPSGLAVGLRSGNRAPAAWQPVDAKGEAELPQIAAGRYEVIVGGAEKPYAIAHISAEGGAVSGRTLTVTAGSSISLSLTLAGGSVAVQGIVKRADKAVAGAMVVLVPKDQEANRDLIRRDQTDLDGSFSLQNVFPGSYTVVAIEKGWDLDWSRPFVMAAYLKGGQTIEVGSQKGRSINLAEAIEVQSK
jgi:Carboxypeptidase regulatory-like domain